MSKQIIWGASPNEKEIATHMDHENGDVIIWDGVEKYIVKYKEFREKRSHYLSCPFKFIPCEEKKTLEETREEFIRTLKLKAEYLSNWK